jgi:sugar/nucleoside kinase (ribokinase family)
MPPQARIASMPQKQVHIWASRPGADSMGSNLPGTMRHEGIDGSKLVSDTAPRTGLMLKRCTSNGSDPAIKYHRASSAASRIGTADVDVDVDAVWIGAHAVQGLVHAEGLPIRAELATAGW